jgi:hypothetical protein
MWNKYAVFVVTPYFHKSIAEGFTASRWFSGDVVICNGQMKDDEL